MSLKILTVWCTVMCACVIFPARAAGAKNDQSAARGYKREIPLKPYFPSETADSLDLRQALSYSHDLNGRLLANAAGQPRNLFRTSNGRILALTLSSNIRNSGMFQLRVTLLGERGANDAVEISLDNRAIGNWSVLEPAQLFPGAKPNWAASPKNPGFAKPQNMGLQTQILDGSNGPLVRLVAWVPGPNQVEVTTASFRALHEWHAERLLAKATRRVEIGERTFAVETIEAGSGSALYDIQELESRPTRSSPTYAVLQNARGRRIADRIPIDESGYDFVWSQAVQNWEVGKVPEPAHKGNSLPDVFERCQRSIVQVVFPGHTNTGIIATYSGEILTCDCHVLNERGLELPVSVKFSDGSIRSGRAHDDEDNKYDLTRVRMNEPLPRLERIPCAAGKPAVGQRCLVLGYRMGEPECRIEEARMGGVDQMRTNARNKTVRHMQLDGLKYFATGQAVLDENGSLIGITCAELVNGPKEPEWRASVPLAVPVEVLRGLLQK